MRAIGLGILFISATAAADPAADALVAGRLDEAATRYESALTASPTNARLWFDMCLVRYASGDFGRAINACYRALPADEGRVLGVIDRISVAMTAQHLAVPHVIVPEPSRSWFAAAHDDTPASAHPVRGTAESMPMVGTFDVIPAANLDGLRGRAPTLPYSIASRAQDYAYGANISARTGVLFYAPDTTPFVAGARVEWIQHDHGAEGHLYYYGEYMHALDGKGGIASAGFGARDQSMLASVGLALPWGHDDDRVHAAFPGHVMSLNGELRIGVHREVMIGRAFAADFEASIVGGLNIAKAGIRIGDAFSDLCLEEKEEKCPPKTPDGNPDWPMYHSMLQIAVTFGHRGGQPAYDRPDLYAPMGGS